MRFSIVPYRSQRFQYITYFKRASTRRTAGTLAGGGYTAMKIPFMYSFSGNCAASVHISMCLWTMSDLYIPIGPPICLQQNRQIDRGNTVSVYINRSQTLECGNCDCGRAIPFLGLFFPNFPDCFFAVIAATWHNYPFYRHYLSSFWFATVAAKVPVF
jgi:hypothetical protein